MTPPVTATLTRALAAASAATGTVLVTCPHAVGRAVTRPGDRIPAPWLVRLLGARMAVQGIAQLARPDRRLVLAGAATDGLHALSLVPVIALDGHHRRAAVTSATVAGANAVAQAALAAALPDRT